MVVNKLPSSEDNIINRKKARDYYREHKEDIKEKRKEYYQKNREKILKKYRENYRKCREAKRKIEIQRRDFLYDLIGSMCYLCDRKRNEGFLYFHEIHGKPHPRTNNKHGYQYIIDHKEDFVTLCIKCHSRLHVMKRYTKNPQKLIELWKALFKEEALFF